MVKISTVILFATGNQKKFEFVTRNIACPAGVIFERIKLDIPEIQAPTVAEVCMNKALQAWEEVKKPVLIHDSGVLIHALNGYPGPYMKDMLKIAGVDKLFEISKHFLDKHVSFEDCLTYVDEFGPQQFVTNSGDMYSFSSRKSESNNSDLPLNSIIAFSDMRDRPFAEMPDLHDVYLRKLKETGEETCWNMFSRFLSEHFGNSRVVI